MPAPIDGLAALPPWDAAPYFQTPVEVTIAVNVTSVQLVTADPNRVAIIFSAGAQAPSPCSVTLNPATGSTRGRSVGPALPPVVMLFSEVGPLVQQAWYGYAVGATTVTVTTIALNRWPQKRPPGGVVNADPAQPIERPGAARRRVARRTKQP